MNKSLYESFKINLESIDIEREDCNLDNLERELNRLERAQKSELPLISKGTTIQTLALEFRYQKLEILKNRELSDETKQKIEELSLELAQIEKRVSERKISNNEIALQSTMKEKLVDRIGLYNNLKRYYDGLYLKI